jgi:hypothetical protein
MVNDNREFRSDGNPVLLALDAPEDDLLFGPLLWLTGSMSLLLWTGLVLLLTSA